MALGIEAENESLEESIFKMLDNQKRRDILRFIGENKQAKFTEIKKSIQMDDSSLLSYHLNTLQPLVTQKNEKYSLSELGQEAYDLIVKTNAFTSRNVVVILLRKQLSALIIANAILWAIAIFSVRAYQGPLRQMTLFAFAGLWFISNLLIYAVLKRTEP